ncbi:uncharacterized protein LOC115966441 [Quercus lobata]|uniref:uncharacterized protein LOC115966441 n=1 Tax=Quercus lobata TaxID=97700 RepID=UPI001246C5B8|nr:uncharacterized protein LOC115966441 [Quercus lobata]
MEELEDIVKVASDYFENLFCVGVCDQMKECLNAVPSKVTNDMQEILSSEISVEEIKVALFQMGPIKASRLDDNVLMAYETLNTMHSRKKGKKGSLALKLDINKAYDQVEWLFLQGIMEKMGFPALWIERVMSCVTTPSFSILVNGKPYAMIHPSRGLSQGDPLLTFLFLLCAKGFTALLAKAKLEGRIKGVSICRRAPKVTNLLFVDDSLLFCQATQTEGEAIAEIL